MSAAEGWGEFAVALAGVAAVLAGLIFVALSVNLDRILRTEGLAARAGESVIVFIGAVLQCAVLLFPEQSSTQLGVELLVVSIVEAALLASLALSAFRLETRQPLSWLIVRVVAALLVTVPVIVVGALLVGGHEARLVWVALSVLWAVVSGTGNAWVLVVEVVRDERYRPTRES